MVLAFLQLDVKLISYHFESSGEVNSLQGGWG